MDHLELRKKFTDFFISREHTLLPPSSLVPENDQSVLFTTAGMQQFKRFYAKPTDTPNARVVTIQPCVRTSDIDEVGDTSHLTFFEMLGNFSFGYPAKEHSYFKKEAIEMAWEFLTEVLKIDTARISATYLACRQAGFKDDAPEIPEDKESLEILQKINGLKKIEPQGLADNFWSLGTEGSPAGPTVEFYIDGIEIWNLVFNEYIFENGKYKPAEFKGVDTGMGLERLIATIDNKTDVYATEIFEPIFSIIQTKSAKIYQDYPREFRLLADHVRAIAHLLIEKVHPSNIGQGYIVRRLIRRSIRRAHTLGMYQNPVSTLVKEYAHSLSDQFSAKEMPAIITEIEAEEDRFKESLNRVLLYKDDLSMALEHNVIKKIHGIPILVAKGVASGEYISENYQSYGTPYDLAFDVVHELGLTYDKAAFDESQKKHAEVSRLSQGQFKGGLASGGEMETKYHTATHLLLAALREILGPEIYQKGSNITAERLRFDFNYPQKLTDEQLHQVDNLVNTKIKEKIPVEMIELPKEEALKTVKVSFDPSKYGDIVKVYKIGDPSRGSHSSLSIKAHPSESKSGQVFSSELCGGPHVKNTGEIGSFKIVKEESSSAGIRRIKAVVE